MTPIMNPSSMTPSPEAPHRKLLTGESSSSGSSARPTLGDKHPPGTSTGPVADDSSFPSTSASSNGSGKRPASTPVNPDFPKKRANKGKTKSRPRRFSTRKKNKRPIVSRGRPTTRDILEKRLMRRRKSSLVRRAEERGLSPSGRMVDLTMKILDHDESEERCKADEAEAAEEAERQAAEEAEEEAREAEGEEAQDEEEKKEIKQEEEEEEEKEIKQEEEEEEEVIYQSIETENRPEDYITDPNTDANANANANGNGNGNAEAATSPSLPDYSSSSSGSPAPLTNYVPVSSGVRVPDWNITRPSRPNLLKIRISLLPRAQTAPLPGTTATSRDCVRRCPVRDDSPKVDPLQTPRNVSMPPPGTIRRCPFP